MADVFKKGNANSLLDGKHILFIGDSNIRALYKDLIWLCQINSLIGLSFLKRRLEESFLGDKLLSRSKLTRGRDFTEHRIFKVGGTTIEFLFVTKCYCDNIIKMVEGIKNGTKHCPDVILMNSCLWDVSRWGPNGVNQYKTNMEKLMKLLSTSLPKHTLFIWATALPIATLTSGGLIIKQIEFLQAILRIHVIEANAFTAGLVSSYGFDVLDFHHYMRYQIIRRSSDGIHFLPAAMRFLTNLLLTHISLSWDVKLPRNLKNFTSTLAAKVEKAIEASTAIEVKQIFKKIGLLADRLNKTGAEDTPKKKKKMRSAKKNQKKSAKKKQKKLAKKKQNIQEAVRNEENAEYTQHETTESQKTLLKTPPHYHKALPVRNKRFPNRPHNRQNFNKQQKYTNYQNFDAAHMYSNFQTCNHFPVYRSQNVNDFNSLQFPLKDFRIMGFNDFQQSSRPSESFVNQSGYSHNTFDYGRVVLPNYSNDYGHYSKYYTNDYTNYYTQSSSEDDQFKVTKTIVNNNLSKSGNINPYYNNYYDRFSAYQSHPYKSSQGGWQTREEREAFQHNPGPMRQRSRYYSERRW